MSLPSVTPRITHTGNGVTTVFAVPFRFDDSDELQVTSILISTGAGTVLSPALYTVAGEGDPTGGTVTYLDGGSPLSALRQLRIERVVGFTQDLVITREGVFDPTTFENQLDRIVMMVQQGQADLALAVSGDTITTITGEVSGPSSAVNERVAVFDGTTGRLLKDGGLTLAQLALASSVNTFVDADGVNNFTALNTFNDDTLFSGQVQSVETVVPDIGDTFTPNFNDGPDFSITQTSAASLTIVNAANVPAAAGRGYISISNTSGATQTIIWGANYVTTTDDSLVTSIKNGQELIYRYWTQASVLHLTLDNQPRLLTLTAEQATTSGTFKDFTGIPAGTKRITLMLDNVSTNGASGLLVQIGDAGGLETSGYISGTLEPAVLYGGSTAGFILTSAQVAATLYSGTITINLQDASNTWVSSSIIHEQSSNIHVGAGTKTLSAELDRVRITTVSGVDLFDAGSVNISYEGGLN